MNVAMQFNDVTDNYINDNVLTEQTINCQNQIKNTFKKVIFKNRQMLQQSVPITKFDKWNRYDECLFLEPSRETLRRNYVYGLHKALELNAKNDILEEKIKHLLELEIVAHEYVYILLLHF